MYWWGQWNTTSGLVLGRFVKFFQNSLYTLKSFLTILVWQICFCFCDDHRQNQTGTFIIGTYMLPDRAWSAGPALTSEHEMEEQRRHVLVGSWSTSLLPLIHRSYRLACPAQCPTTVLYRREGRMVRHDNHILNHYEEMHLKKKEMTIYSNGAQDQSAVNMAKQERNLNFWFLKLKWTYCPDWFTYSRLCW